MRVIWVPNASKNITDLGGGTPVGALEDALTPPRERFVRINLVGGLGFSLFIDPPTTRDIDVSAAVACFRVMNVDTIADTDVVQWRIQFIPQDSGDAPIDNSIDRTDAAISGSSPFTSVGHTITNSGQRGVVTFNNSPGDVFNGWVCCSVVLSSIGVAAAESLKVTISSSTPLGNNLLVDVGFLGWARHWNAGEIQDSESFKLTPIDPSIKQVSDGGQLFATKVDKRRRVSFDINPSDEETVIITDAPESGGIMTIADQIGTTIPAMWIPDDDRAFKTSMNTFGTVEEWPPLNYEGSNRWSIQGIVVNELI